MNRIPEKVLTAFKDVVNKLTKTIGGEASIRQSDDADIFELKIKKSKMERPIHYVENLTQSNINTIISQHKLLYPHHLLLTRYITKANAEQLQSEQLFFVDLSGNIHINVPPIYLFIKGESPTGAKSVTPRLFSVSGIKIIFACLSNPGLENSSYRNIAKISQVSLGSVENILRALRTSDFLVAARNQGKRTLINKIDLLNRWCIAYADNLQPKLIIGQYSCEDKRWWERAVLEHETAVWGGEVAASKLTKYLKPEKVSIYTNNNLPQVQAKYALRESEHGEVVFYKRFWNFQLDTKNDLTPVILIYADLINSTVDRNIETAGMIYEKYITKLIE